MVNGDYVHVDVDIKYNAVKEFIEVGSKDQQVSRPVVSTKSIVTRAVMNPGDLIALGSMRYQREFKAKSGLWSLFDYGLKASESRYYEITALMSCQVLEYKVEM